MAHSALLAPLLALLSSVDIATDFALLVEVKVKIGLIVVGAQTELVALKPTLSSIFESWLSAGRAVEFLLESSFPLTCFRVRLYRELNWFLLCVCRGPFVFFGTSLQTFSVMTLFRKLRAREGFNSKRAVSLLVLAHISLDA